MLHKVTLSSKNIAEAFLGDFSKNDIWVMLRPSRTRQGTIFLGWSVRSLSNEKDKESTYVEAVSLDCLRAVEDVP